MSCLKPAVETAGEVRVVPSALDIIGDLSIFVICDSGLFTEPHYDSGEAINFNGVLLKM